MVLRNCQLCNSEFYTTNYKIKIGKGKFCSQQCVGKYKKLYYPKIDCHPLYKTWISMKNRCNNEKYPQFHYYGERGIKVCDRWLHSFENFINDMGDKPDSSYTLDRIDNDKGYSPENCRWATKREQVLNRRNNYKITIKGISKTALEWSREIGITRNALKKRVKANWSDEDIINVPQNGKRKYYNKTRE